MMKDKTKQYLSWLAMILWMVVIFLFSAQTDRQSGNLSGGIVRWFVALIMVYKVVYLELRANA